MYNLSCLNFMIFSPFFSNLGTAYREGRMWQKFVRTALEQPCFQYTMTHATLVGQRYPVSSGAILGPHHLISALYWCYYSSRDFGGSTKSLP